MICDIENLAETDDEVTANSVHIDPSLSYSLNNQRSNVILTNLAGVGIEGHKSQSFVVGPGCQQFTTAIKR